MFYYNSQSRNNGVSGVTDHSTNVNVCGR